MELSIRKNTNGLMIDTPLGMSAFTGIKRIKASKYFRFELCNGSKIDITTKHKFKTPDGFKEAQDFTFFNKIVSRGGELTVTNIELIEEEKYFYDVTDVEKENQYYTNDVVSHNCEFLGGSFTLIASAILRRLLPEPVLHLNTEGTTKIIESAKEDHTYFMSVDVARGSGQDYSTISVIDITAFPNKQVAVYRNNQISSLLFPNVIEAFGKQYNDAFCLIESNDIGIAVLNIMNWEYEYENLIFTRTGNQKRSRMGLRVDRKTKRIGCNRLKDMIESNNMLVTTEETIDELYHFQAKGDSFEADMGNDDIVMGLVNFAYYANTENYKNLVDQDFRKEFAEYAEEMEKEALTPLPIMDNGVNDTINSERYQMENNGYVDGSHDKGFMA